MAFTIPASSSSSCPSLWGTSLALHAYLFNYDFDIGNSARKEVVNLHQSPNLLDGAFSPVSLFLFRYTFGPGFHYLRSTGLFP